MVRRKSFELWASLAAIILITIVYLLVVWWLGSIPKASDFFGHSLGVAGFLLMLMTETLYSLRKRSRSSRWGRMSSWLSFHIFTGLVGPYMVLLHSAWRFNGLAGVLLYMTLIVVASGFIGRYIYTAVPRSADGIVLEAEQVSAMLAAVDGQLNTFADTRPALAAQVRAEMQALPQPQQGEWLMVLGRFFSEMGYRRRLRSVMRQTDAGQRQQVRQMQALLRQRRMLDRQLAMMAVARRLLAVWHSVHIPIGMALFTVAFIHIGAAMYYATFLH